MPTVDEARAAADRYKAELTKYCVLSNSGGAVAVLSFIGATSLSHKTALVPLLFFAVGLLLGGLGHLGTFIDALVGKYRAEGKEIEDNGRPLAKIMLWSAANESVIFFLSYGSLILGVISGLVMMALAEPPPTVIHYMMD